MSVQGFKTNVDPLTCMLFHLHGFLKFTSGAKPTGLLMNFKLAAFCDVPSLPHGSVVSSSKCHNGTCEWGGTVILACDTGYSMSGSGELTCIGYGKYTPAVPTCTGKASLFVKKKYVSSRHEPIWLFLDLSL